MNVELGILGAGNMAEAIARGALRAGILKPGEIVAADVSPQRRGVFEGDLGIRAVADNLEVARQSKMLLLSVKPQHMAEALAGVGEVAGPGTLIISIAAGIGTRFIEMNLGGSHSWRVIRSMPNTPMLVGEGMVAIARGRHATEKDAADARRLFGAAASVIEVPEDRIDAVTAVSGSGPAYVFFLIEQMIRAATELGLAQDQARQLAVKTVLGAAVMLQNSADSPAELRQKVTSPGGTTQAAITHLERHHVDGAIVDAIKAAERRAKELGL